MHPLTLALIALLAPTQEKEKEARLVYQVQFPADFKGDRKEIAQKTLDVLRKRINQRGLKEPRLSILADDRVVIEIAAAKREEIDDYIALLAQVGKLELKAVASGEIHRRWKETGQVPPGVEAVDNNEKMSGEYDYLGGDRILLVKEAVVTGGDIRSASPTQSYTTGKDGWKIHFEMTEDGGKRFDAAAKDLFRHSPKGLIAIILDGKILSKPTIRSEKFGGSGEITGGFSKAEAENLAVCLRSGALPFPLKLVEEK